MTDHLVAYERTATGIATITLCAEARGNAINTEMVQQLANAVARAHRDAVGVIVIRATGRFFCVGGDLAAFESTAELPAYVDDLAESLHRVLLDLAESDAIVVAAVQGTAAGAGFPLATAADIIVAASTAQFTLGYTKVGLTPDGGTSLLVRSLGVHRVLYLALTNSPLSASEAYAAGLVARVVTPDLLDEVVDQLAHTLAAGSSTAQSGTKQLIRQAFTKSSAEAFHAEVTSLRTHAGTQDSLEGISAFIDKRAPDFVSRP